MHKSTLISILVSLCLNACTGQANDRTKAMSLVEFSPKASKDSTKTSTGIVYFSRDNGRNWENESTGLPTKVSIGLGGIAISENLLGLATKEHGVYLYHTAGSNWTNVPTSKEIIEGNIGALALFKNTILIGTQHKGVFTSKNQGQTWVPQNAGLANQSIRRFIEYKGALYVCTNDGFYVFNEILLGWELKFGFASLQVNGATHFNGSFYLATNQGIYQEAKGQVWVNVAPKVSVHNISSDDNALYAMTYDVLLITSSDGTNWSNIQEGLPKKLYTFNVLNQNGTLFAGQWDGIYKKTGPFDTWVSSSKGLPDGFAATNMKSFKGILVISTAERKLKGE
jgi:hypothetical protein